MAKWISQFEYDSKIGGVMDSKEDAVQVGRKATALYQRCEKMRPTLFRLASDTEDNDEALAEILQANDNLTQAINMYKKIVKGEEINGMTELPNIKDILGKDCLMSGSRVLDASKQKMEKPLQLIFKQDGKLQLNSEALNFLQSIEDIMVIVAMVGAAHTGKSYLMNCLAGDKGFKVNSTMQAHTEGIWMRCLSLPQRPNEVLLLLDTEGLGVPDKGDIDNDNSIYLLAILLSSIFIYNTSSFMTELSKRIQMRSQPDVSDSSDFVRCFPEFVWVIRDLTLDLKVGGKDATPNDNLEHILKLKCGEISKKHKKYNEIRRCIRDNFPSRCCFAFPIPTHAKKLKKLQELQDKNLDGDFVKERQNLINYIHTHKNVKRVLGGQPITGRRFVELAKQYVGMMADRVIPCVERSVAKLVEVENQAAVAEALKFYEDGMEKITESGCLTISTLRKNHNARSIEAFNIFHKRSMNTNSGKYIQQLEEKISSTYKPLMVKIKEKFEKECEIHVEKVMSSIKKNLTSGHYQKPGGIQELKKDFDKAIKEYEGRTKNEMEALAVLLRFLEEEKPNLEHVQEKGSEQTAKRMRVSALEQELERVKEDMEKMEQKRKETERCRNKEIMEQIKKMFEEGKTCKVEELKEAMEHMRSEMEKYQGEGRMEDAERAQLSFLNFDESSLSDYFN
ncbi:guanylate-binding protein 1-like [Hypanus sabinus]|uniref:guanylate-binding protein 1-like n=1 Tax=Hypanus sabinus TaxID=79690 RepID=UPI0028C50A79|nr:guanylate-binding protein 1-like [Hypanus sabinus]